MVASLGTGERLASSRGGCPSAAMVMLMLSRNPKVSPAGSITVRVSDLSWAELAAEAPCALIDDWRSIWSGIWKRPCGSSAATGLPGMVCSGMGWATSKPTSPQAASRITQAADLRRIPPNVTPAWLPGKAGRAMMARHVDILRQDLRLALRLLWRDRAYALTSVLTLALCIGANSAIFTVVRSVLLRPLPYPESDRLVFMFDTFPGAGAERAGTSVPNYYDRVALTDAFDSVALYQLGRVRVGEGPGAAGVASTRV